MQYKRLGEKAFLEYDIEIGWKRLGLIVYKSYTGSLWIAIKNTRIKRDYNRKNICFIEIGDIRRRIS